MQGDGLPEDLDSGATIQVPRFGPGQKIFRRYTLQKIIGRGGMGVVWLAQDAYLESLVALKVLPDTLLHDSASLDSLKRETKVGLSLAHPNIVRIYDFQNDETAAAISMEYVDGGNLSDLRVTKTNKILTHRDLLAWIESLFDALEYAHVRRQIVHRDLKPRNLMLNQRGELKIADFGISRSISDSMTMLTGKLGSSGSPPYVSPQQWDGERPTPLDDIYSLGATLYELLTSKPPLLGVIDWQQVHHKIAPPMSQRRIDLGILDAEAIPHQWEEAVAACLAKDPKDRPQSIRELKARLLIDGLQASGPATLSAGDSTLSREVASSVEEDIDDRFEMTIKGGGAAPPSHLEDDESIFEAPTLRQVKERPATAQPADDLDTGLTIRSPKPELAAPQEMAERGATADRAKKKPVLLWLALAAAGLLCAIGYIIFRPVEPVIDTPIAAPAELTVETDPAGATITLDEGANVPAPHVFKDVKAGAHRITANLDGYLPAQQDLQSDGETSSKIVLKLEKQPPPAETPQPTPPPEQFGMLSVTTNPPGASIYLDENPPNEPPNTFKGIPFGKHQLTANLDGYEPIYEELEIDSTSPVYKVFELKRTQQSLRLQELVDQVKKYADAPDSPQYITAAAKYLLHLYYTESPPSPELPPDELKQSLETIIERLRTRLAALKPSVSAQEFQQYREAITYAAKLDSLQANLTLAENEKEQHKKFSLFEKAATQKNDPGAMMMLGILYAKGAADISGKPDYDKALDWLQKAAKAGNKEAAAYYNEAYLFVDTRTPRTEGEQEAAIESLRELAQQGVPHAEVVLGEWCRRKAIATKDKASRLKLYREAADRWRRAKGPREWRASYYLGSLYERGLLNEDGKPTQSDLNEAKALYKEGADNEDLVCMFNLGRFIWEHSNDKNADERKQALSLIKNAAAAGSESAKSWLERLGQQ
jgi:serine/threonine protein kinase/TPR repeat protein